jgi:hypothetical protein
MLAVHHFGRLQTYQQISDYTEKASQEQML